MEFYATANKDEIMTFAKKKWTNLEIAKQNKPDSER